jgi:hypothetical protein
MESLDTPPKQTPRRKIVIDYEAFGMGNVEAWANIIRSYKELHPEHHVLLFYEDKQVSNLTYLFKVGKPVNRGRFEMCVTGRDENFRHVPKLFRLLVEGAGPDYQKFVVPEIHRTLKLF